MKKWIQLTNALVIAGFCFSANATKVSESEATQDFQRPTQTADLGHLAYIQCVNGSRDQMVIATCRARYFPDGNLRVREETLEQSASAAR